MWYVKVFDNLKSSFAELDFILTKWYVKPIEPTYLNVSPIRFYINYVEKINKKKALTFGRCFVLLKLVG